MTIKSVRNLYYYFFFLHPHDPKEHARGMQYMHYESVTHVKGDASHHQRHLQILDVLAVPIKKTKHKNVTINCKKNAQN